MDGFPLFDDSFVVAVFLNASALYARNKAFLEAHANHKFRFLPQLIREDVNDASLIRNACNI